MNKHESLEIEDQENGLIENGCKTNMKCKFYFWALLATFLFGSKMVCIGVSKMDKYYIYFVDHFAIFLSALLYYGIIVLNWYYSNKNQQNGKGGSSLSLGRIFRDKRILACSIVGGVADTFGNLFIIYAIKFCFEAGVSPASINCLIMLNTVFMLIVGILYFKEKHTKMEYLGACMIFLALVVITMQRGSSNNNDGGDNKAMAFYLSILCTVICSCFWGCFMFLAKFAVYHYNAIPEEYSMMAMIASGLSGSVAIFGIYWLGIEMNPADEDQIWLYMMGAAGAGVFTTFGIYSFNKAISLGSVEVASLFSNMRVIVQIVEELIIFQIFPSFISFIGVIFALSGSAIMIMYENKNAHVTHKSQK